MQEYKVTKRCHKVAIIASGLSLVGVDFSNHGFRNDGYIICVNDSWRNPLAPDPDCVVTIDTVKLTERFRGCPHKVIAGVPDNFGTHKAKEPIDRIPPKRSLLTMRRLGLLGFSEDEGAIHSGENSGYAAFNLAYLMRPEHIFLFGIDLTNMGQHCHQHTDPRKRLPVTEDRLPGNFFSVVPQVESKGIKVINGSLISKVPHFRQVSPHEAIRAWNFIGSENDRV